ncbi:hypothetical protein [Streptomyces lasalocidi]|uniref:Uncharacterized protein n=1 Tax=Streptomyces lasalocidi TaxID=324833 RepID=A0A4U5W4V7_STRLS|nr:hypothetical protein [Streptomyces lasalocidi]TKS96378.1 hypothetical protein E4U91_37630 [Streptomyces lasalocidi]
MSKSDILLTAFTRGRQAVDSYVSESARREHNWGEESATERLLMAAWPDVPYAPFNRRQEKAIGADWLWWFVDLTGECFGIIVQAKKMKQTKTGLTVDFKYPKSTGQQMNDLFTTAREFNLPAAYMLYCGDTQYRRDSNSWCPACSGKDPHCRRCERAGTLLLPALAADHLRFHTPSIAAEDAFRDGFPLEDAVDRNVSTKPLIQDLNIRSLDPPLREFLVTPQHGPREIAKMMFEVVSRMRRGQFSAVAPERPAISNEETLVFPATPRDTGHFRTPYYPHILNGLRRRLPEYVEPVMNGTLPPSDLSDRLAGMILVRI